MCQLVFYPSDRPVQDVGLGRSPAGVAGPTPAGGMCKRRVLSDRDLYVGLITRPEVSYRLLCVCV